MVVAAGEGQGGTPTGRADSLTGRCATIHVIVWRTGWCSATLPYTVLVVGVVSQGLW